jgi:hypothetical protein
MRRWPFHLASGTLMGIFLLDLKFAFLGVTPNVRLAFPVVSVAVLLVAYFDGVLGNISHFKGTFNPSEGGTIEIRRKVEQAERSSEKALAAVTKEFSMPLGTYPTVGTGSPTGEPWKDMLRVSDLMVRRLAERAGEDPDLLAEIPLPSAIKLAETKGQITKRQAKALNGFYEARQTLIEICLQLRGDTPMSIHAKALRLSSAGEQLASIL